MVERDRDYKAYTISLDGVVRYVGITVDTIKRRWGQHCCAKRDSALRRAITKHGKGAFVVEHVASSWDIKSINALEAILVAQYDTFGSKGYNMTCGGNQPLVFLPEVRARITAKLQNMSADTKKQMSESAKRRYSTPEGKAAQSASQRVRWTSEARSAQAERARMLYAKPGAKEAQSARLRERFSNPEERAATGAQAKARLASPEARAAHADRVRKAMATPEAKAKMSASQKRRFETDQTTLDKANVARVAYQARSAATP